MYFCITKALLDTPAMCSNVKVGLGIIFILWTINDANMI